MSDSQKGRKLSIDHCAKMSAAMSGKKWWNNGIENRRAAECPGPEWARGRTKRGKK